MIQHTGKWQEMTILTIARVQVKQRVANVSSLKVKSRKKKQKCTQNADNTPDRPIITNPMVRGNNNNDNNNDLITDLIADTRNNGSIDFLSELLNSHSLVSDAKRKNDMITKTHKLILIVSI